MKKDHSKEMAEEYEGRTSSEQMSTLRELLAQPDNQFCADCEVPDPKWASTNIGVFICIKCSGVHRSLGVHISKVLSVTLDEWTDSQIQTMIEVGGNAAANAIYEAFLPPHSMKPGLHASVEERSEFIRRKYKDQEFLKPTLRISSSTSMPMFSSNSKKSLKLQSLGKKPSGKMVRNSRLSRLSHAFRKSWKKWDTKEIEAKISIVGMVEFLGLLKIRVIRGRNLAVRDMRSSDPYVVLMIGQQKTKTHVVKSNLNPIWNEELMLSVPIPPAPLKVEVYDKDTFSADDIMGEAEVDLQPLVSSARIHEDINQEAVQIGKWLATSDNALIGDSIIWLKDGQVKQDVSLKLQNVESGELDLELEWVPLIQ